MPAGHRGVITGFLQNGCCTARGAGASGGRPTAAILLCNQFTDWLLVNDLVCTGCRGGMPSTNTYIYLHRYIAIYPAYRSELYCQALHTCYVASWTQEAARGRQTVTLAKFLQSRTHTWLGKCMCVQDEGHMQCIHKLRAWLKDFLRRSHCPFWRPADCRLACLPIYHDDGRRLSGNTMRCW